MHIGNTINERFFQMRITNLHRLATAAAACLALLPLSGCAAIGNLLGQDQVHSTTLKVGECIQELGEEQVMNVERVECSESHVYEVYAEKSLPDGDFPAPRAIDEESQTFCAQEFATFVGVPYEESTLEFMRLTPSAETWAEGDRLITCLIQDPAGPVTNSLRDANR